MNTLKLIDTEIYNDEAKLVSVSGQGCNYETCKGLENYLVQFRVVANNKAFCIAYQPLDKSDNIMAYSGWEMDFATLYGYDGDESQEFIKFCEDNEIDGCDEFLETLHKEAKALAKMEIESLQDNEV